MRHEPLAGVTHPILHLTVPHCLPDLQAPPGSPPDVWRQLPQEVLRVAQQQVADLSATAVVSTWDADRLCAAKQVQAAAERCIRAIQRAQQLP